MADTDLPISGKDTKLTLVVDGTLVDVVDKITNFSSRATYDTMETKGLGTTETHIDKVLVGWSGDLEIAVARKTIDELMDVIHAAQANRVPVVINIHDTTHYRNGTSKSYVYPDCKVEFEARKRRGESQTASLSWATGKDRVAL